MFQPEALVNRTRSGAKELSRQGYRGRRGGCRKNRGTTPCIASRTGVYQKAKATGTGADVPLR